MSSWRQGSGSGRLRDGEHQRAILRLYAGGILGDDVIAVGLDPRGPGDLSCREAVGLRDEPLERQVGEYDLAGVFVGPAVAVAGCVGFQRSCFVGGADGLRLGGRGPGQ
jgi:hypothetical protein